MYRPIIKFASKDRAKTPLHVLYIEHYTATFPQVYKTEHGAINFARRNMKKEDGVWQLPGAQAVE